MGRSLCGQVTFTFLSDEVQKLRPFEIFDVLQHVDVFAQAHRELTDFPSRQVHLLRERREVVDHLALRLKLRFGRLLTRDDVVFLRVVRHGRRSRRVGPPARRRVGPRPPGFVSVNAKEARGGGVALQRGEKTTHEKRRRPDRTRIIHDGGFCCSHLTRLRAERGGLAFLRTVEETTGATRLHSRLLLSRWRKRGRWRRLHWTLHEFFVFIIRHLIELFFLLFRLDYRRLLWTGDETTQRLLSFFSRIPCIRIHRE